MPLCAKVEFYRLVEEILFHDQQSGIKVSILFQVSHQSICDTLGIS